MKRLFDVVASTLLLALLAPVLVLIAVVVALRLGRPVLFTQERPGLHGRSAGGRRPIRRLVRC